MPEKLRNEVLILAVLVLALSREPQWLVVIVTLVLSARLFWISAKGLYLLSIEIWKDVRAALTQGTD